MNVCTFILFTHSRVQYCLVVLVHCIACGTPVHCIVCGDTCMLYFVCADTCTLYCVLAHVRM